MIMFLIVDVMWIKHHSLMVWDSLCILTLTCQLLFLFLQLNFRILLKAHISLNFHGWDLITKIMSCGWSLNIDLSLVQLDKKTCGRYQCLLILLAKNWPYDFHIVDTTHIATLNILISECGKLVKVVLNSFTLWISATKRFRKHWSTWYLTRFIDKHVAHTNHKHTLVFLKSMVNEHRIYCSHKYSVT